MGHGFEGLHSDDNRRFYTDRRRVEARATTNNAWRWNGAGGPPNRSGNKHVKEIVYRAAIAAGGTAFLLAIWLIQYIRSISG